MFSYFKRKLTLQFVVIVIIIILADKFLKPFVEEREQAVVDQLVNIENEKKTIQEKLLQTQNELQLAHIKSQEISTSQADISFQNIKEKLDLKAQEKIQQFKKNSEETIFFQKGKTRNQFFKRFIQLIINRAQEKLKNRVDSVFQLAMNNFYIALLCDHQSINQS